METPYDDERPVSKDEDALFDLIELAHIDEPLRRDMQTLLSNLGDALHAASTRECVACLARQLAEESPDLSS